MKISANQANLNASANNALSGLDLLKGKGFDKNGELEEKFLDLLAQLFQGASLQNQAAKLDQQLAIPVVKAASLPERDKAEDLLAKHPLKELPKANEKAAPPAEIQKSESLSKSKDAPSVDAPVKSDTAKPVEAVAADAAPEAADAAPTTEQHVAEKCGNIRPGTALAPVAGPSSATPSAQAANAAAPAEASAELEVAAEPVGAVAAAPQELAPEVSKEMSDVVKKILAEIRKSIIQKDSPELTQELAGFDKRELQPLHLVQQLFNNSNPDLNLAQKQNVDLAALVARLKQINPQLGNSQDLLNRLTALTAKGSLETAIGALSNSADKLLARPVKQSPLAELASKRASEIIEKIKDAVAQAVKSRDGNSLTLNLNPKDLGEVVVKVQQRDDQIFAKITPKAVEVQEIVKAKVDEIVKLLTAAGFKQNHIHISVGGSFDLTENGSRFAPYSSGEGHSGSSRKPKGEEKQGSFQGRPDISDSKASNSSELAGWVA